MRWGEGLTSWKMLSPPTNSLLTGLTVPSCKEAITTAIHKISQTTMCSFVRSRTKFRRSQRYDGNVPEWRSVGGLPQLACINVEGAGAHNKHSSEASLPVRQQRMLTQRPDS
jgi:hypothetical protein